MAFLFYIDNQLTDQPVNDTALITSIKRDNQLNALLITQDVELIYNGNNALGTGEVSGYSVLKTLFDEAICNEVEMEVYDQVSDSVTVLIYKGIIKIPQVAIQEQEILLSCKVQDNSFYSFINNNKDIKVNFLANATKSQEAFTPCQWYSVDFYNSMNCIYGSNIGFFYQGYLLTDAFRFIVAAITDNRVGFQSDYLDSLTEPLMIFKGQALLNSYTIYPAAPEPQVEISFAELLREAHKIYNLIFFIDDSDVNNPILRIENYEYIYGNIITHNFDDLKEIKSSVDTKNLYSAVKVGSTVVIDGQLPEYTWNSATSYYGWKEETFFPLGQCNTSNELDLVSNFIIDSNAIQDTVALGSTAEIDSYFLVQCSNIDTVGLTADAHQFAYFAAGGCYFNLGINNFFKMQRFSVLFETTFGNFLGIGTNGFRALLGDSAVQDLYFTTVPSGGMTTIPALVDPVEYVNETTNGGYDGGNNYDNTTFEYTVPVTGDYSFLSRFSVAVAGMLGNVSGFLDTFTVTNTINVYDAGMVFKFAASQVFSLAGAGANGFHTLDTVLVANVDATDIVNTSFRINYAPNQSGNQQQPRILVLLSTSFFECNGTPEGGVSITAGNTTVKKYLHEFNVDVDQTDFLTIKSNPTGMIAFEKDGVTRYGWIESMQHNDWTGQTNIKLITSNATT